MNVDSLPVPKLYNAVHESHVRTVFKVLGIALIVQWILPWGNGMWSFSRGLMGFATMWSLLAGIGLTVLGFLKNDALKPGLLVAIGGGVGFLGIISVVTVAGIGAALPSMGFFGLIGLTVCIFGLWLWARQGHSALAYWLVIGGLGSIALSLLIPVGGEVPLVMWFKVFGASHINIVARIFFFLLFTLYVGIGVLTLLFVVLKGEKADKGWVNLMGAAMFLYIPISSLLLGLMMMFSSGAALLMMFHIAVIIVAYMWLTLSAAVIIIDAAQEGRLKSLF